MGSYICLTCGAFQSGDENRRMMNYCPDCELKQTDSGLTNDTSAQSEDAIEGSPDTPAAEKYKD